MIRKKGWLINSMLVLALIAQALPCAAQESRKTPAVDLPIKAAQNGANEASVRVDRITPLTNVAAGEQSVEIAWTEKAPAGVSIQGFDVNLQVGLGDGSVLKYSHPFGGDARTAIISFKLPAAPANNNTGAGNNGGKNGDAGGGIGDLQQVRCQLSCEGSSKNAASIQKCIDDCLRGGGGATGGGGGKGATEGVKLNRGGDNGARGGNGGGKLISGGKSPFPGVLSKADPPVRVTSFTASVTGRFSSEVEAAASREFVPPANKLTGALTPGASRNSGSENFALRINELIHINEIAQRANDCPAGKDCFDVVAQARSAGATNAQFKVALELIYPNGQRRDTSRAAGSLSNPIRLIVDRPVGPEFSSAVVFINAHGEASFTKNGSLTVPFGGQVIKR